MTKQPGNARQGSFEAGDTIDIIGRIDTCCAAGLEGDTAFVATAGVMLLP